MVVTAELFGLGSGLLVRDTEIGYRPGALELLGKPGALELLGKFSTRRRALDNGSVAMGP
jgi:hypothetical protein